MKYYGNIHNQSIAMNGGRVGGILSVDATGLEQGIWEAFKEDVRRTVNNPSNAGKNIVSPRPITYTDYLTKLRDMDFSNLIESTRQEIYSKFRVPQALVSTSAQTYDNYRTAIEAFYDFAVLPEARHIYANLGDMIIARFPKLTQGNRKFRLDIDERTLPALKQRMFDRALSMRNIGVFSQNEIRNETGRENIEDQTEGDRIYISATLVAAGEQDYRSPADIQYEDENIKPGQVVQAEKPAEDKPNDQAVESEAG